MPYNNYVESYCDVCGHVIHGSVPVLDGTPENHGLIFCCSECIEIHNDDVKGTKLWRINHNIENDFYTPHTPHRECYRHFCFGCKNFRNLDKNSHRRGVWYNHVCCISDNIIGIKTRTDINKKFGYCREAIKECFKHREPIKVEISRFELMDFG